MSELIKAIAVTAELMGTEWSEEAARAVAEELALYPIGYVKQALSRCRQELKGRLTLAEILDRLPGGHPGPEEAWSIVSRSMQNEDVSIVWTEQMREAYGVARALVSDPVAARMAFKESYVGLVSVARTHRKAPAWSISLGYDVAGREVAAQEAIEKGRLSMAYAQMVAPSLPPPSAQTVALIEQVSK